MADWVLEIERGYVAAATGGTREPVADRARALAAAGAIASHYLAVGTPRSFGLVADAATVDAAALSLEAHRTWFAPRDVRSTVAAGPGRVVELAEALACDIVCIHVPLALGPAQLRRGTHVNALAAVALDPELASIAIMTHEQPGLGELAAGLVDGRQLDEITIFIASR